MSRIRTEYRRPASASMQGSQLGGCSGLMGQLLVHRAHTRQVLGQAMPGHSLHSISHRALA